MIILVAILWLALFLLFIKFVIMLANIPESKIQSPPTLKTVHVHIHNKAKITMNLKPQDLRLGIIIHDTVRNTNTTLQLKHFRELSISEEQFFNRYKPVAITDQMLLDFEFVKHSDDFVFGILSMEARKNDKRSKYNEEDYACWSWDSYVREVTYAHEIQSLYYDMIGEELNISNFLLRN